MVTVKSKRKVYIGRVVRVQEVDLDFGNGRQATFELMAFNTLTGVSALPVTKSGVILIKHYQVGLGHESWSLPTGGLNRGEDPAERMQLELQEEIGFMAGKLTLMLRVHPLPGYVGSIPGYLFLAQDLTPSRLEGDEDYPIEVQPLTWKQVNKMLMNNEIIDNRTITALLYYERFMK